MISNISFHKDGSKFIKPNTILNCFSARKITIKDIYTYSSVGPCSRDPADPRKAFTGFQYTYGPQKRA